MNAFSIRRPVAALLATALLPLAGLISFACAGDPVREIEVRRTKYTASLAGFVVKDVPGAPKPQIVLDVLVAGGSKPPLAGLTLDVSMAGADGKEKAHRKAWVETATVGVSGEQKTIVFDDLDYQAGDGFWVEIRTPIPAAERGDYRELGAPR